LIAPFRNILLLGSVVLCLTGCTVGHDYAGPPPIGDKAPAVFARASHEDTSVAPVVAQWWLSLNDPVLNSLEIRALRANADLAVADAHVREARAVLTGQRASGLPKGSVNGSYLHASLPGLSVQQSDGGGTSTFDFFNLGFDASWEIDLFGGQRRSVQAASADAQSMTAKLGDAQVSITADVANAFVGLRDRQRRLVLGRRSLDLGEQALALGRQRQARGTISAADLAEIERQLDDTRAQLTPLNAERDGYLNQLAVLTGVTPGTLDAELDADNDAHIPLPPASVAIGDPTTLLSRRPDIRAAERDLAADTARLGGAQADRFPKVKFMGILGLGGTKPSDIFDIGKLTSLLAPQISWDFLDFGRTKARVRQAEAKRDEAEARYKAAVLKGLQDAEDSLSRFRDRRLVVADRALGLANARRGADFADQRAQAGTVTRSDTIKAERDALDAEATLIADEAKLTSAFISVQKALGLGWQ
jgi:NodT family efflux transporter outer membrane factor (OMF) lipoprotein